MRISAVAVTAQVQDVTGLLDRLLGFLELGKPSVTAETLIQMKDLLRRYPHIAEVAIASVASISPEVPKSVAGPANRSIQSDQTLHPLLCAYSFHLEVGHLCPDRCDRTWMKPRRGLRSSGFWGSTATTYRCPSAVACVDQLLSASPRFLMPCLCRYAFISICCCGGATQDAPYLLELVAADWASQALAVRLALLTAAAKLFFARPPECQRLLGSLLALAAADTDQDVHDRGLLYYRWVAPAPVTSSCTCFGCARML